MQRVLRQTRCVTLFYADKMHLDVTPSLRVYGTLDRELHGHAKARTARLMIALVDMNAYGFAQWYASRTPLELRMAKEFHRRWLDHAGLAARADADVDDDVPDQCDFVVKEYRDARPPALKRYRNIRYTSYSGRIPPSVMLSITLGSPRSRTVAQRDARTPRELDHPPRDRASLALRAAPACRQSGLRGRHLPDRWPESVAQQDEFAKHLHELVRSLRRAMRKGEMFPNTMMDVLRGNFGDRVVTRAADQIAAEIGGGIQR